jgi:mRNA interferase MazF
MVIDQGDLFWLDLPDSNKSSPAYRHPCVVVQNDLVNHRPIQTTIVCLLTSNLRRAKSPANLLLEAGEANLPKTSVVVVTQILTVTTLESKRCRTATRRERRSSFSASCWDCHRGLRFGGNIRAIDPRSNRLPARQTKPETTGQRLDADTFPRRSLSRPKNYSPSSGSC